MRTFVNVSQLADYGVQLSENQVRRLTERKTELAMFATLCRLVEIAHLSEYDGKHHIDDADVLLEYKGHLLRAYRSHYNANTYLFCLPDPYRHDHTRYYKNAHPTPNKVGAPTARKLDEWLNYLLTEDEERKEYAQTYIDQETAFRARLAQLGDMVRWFTETTGHIVKNNVVLEFQIAPCSISQKVSIRRAYDLGIEGFLQMADNQYRPAQA